MSNREGTELRKSGMKNTNHKKHRHSNCHFSDNYCYIGDLNIPTDITLTTYDKDSVETHPVNPDTASFKSLVQNDRINWFQIHGLTNTEAITRLAGEFGLHNLDIRDILTPVHVVKIDNYNGRLFLILNSCYFDDNNELRTNHIAILVTGNIVISFTENEHGPFKSVLDSLSADTMDIRNRKSGFLLGFLLNTFFSSQIDTASHVEDTLEGIEYVLLGEGHGHGKINTQIQRCRHAYLILRKNLYPLKEQFTKMLQHPNDIIDNEMIPLFDDLSDQLAYVIQITSNCRELLASLVDLYISKNDLRTNAIMKHLTVMATMFIPTTFLVGVWGMNFKIMPELDLNYGYFFAWSILFLTALGTWLIMKKKKWF